MQFELSRDLKGEEILLTLLSKHNFKINKHGQIYKRIQLEKKFCSDAYIEITQILYSEMVTNGAKLDVYYQDSNSYSNQFPTPLEVTATFSGNIQFNFTPVAEKLKSFSKSKSPFFNEIVTVYKEYFKLCVKEYLTSHPSLLAYCGWFIDEQQKMLFKSVNYLDTAVTDISHSKTEPVIFNGVFSTAHPLAKMPLEDYCKQRDNLSDFFNLLSNPNALLLFTYTIHAVLLDYAHEYPLIAENIVNTNDALFSLCIYGQDIKHINTIANLLLNIFDIHKNKWSIISRKIHLSASSISDTNFWNLKLYRDVPIIITTRNNHFYRSSSIIKRIQRQREKGVFHFFPVYISSAPINADEIVNCCIDNILPASKDTIILEQIHFDFFTLLYHFIVYLSDISGKNKNYDKWHNPIDDIRYITNRISALLDEYSEENPEADFSYLVDTKLPNFLLLASIECFCRFLEQTPLRAYSDKLKNELRLYLFPLNKDSSTPIEGNTLNYILLLSNFLQDNIQKEGNQAWLFDGAEKRGNKENCYYLTTSEGYNNFLLYLKKKHIPIITKQAFIKELESHKLLKLLSSTTAKSNKRRGKYVYIIKKDILNELVHNCINPQAN